MLKTSYTGNRIECGCDEAGRGCLAGPVVAAAVVWPHGKTLEGLDDSKKLNRQERECLVPLIREIAVEWAIAEVDETEIDRINILKATFLAMGKAISSIKTKPELLLIDGNRFPGYPGIPHQCIVKGDGQYLSIAAASVLAKVHRDQLMADLARQHPQYKWEKNAGYGTREHMIALNKFGVSPFHRKSFLPVRQQLELFHQENSGHKD